MNSLERVLATIKGEKKDRPPLSLTLSLYGAKLTGCPLNEYYTNHNKYIEGQLAVFDKIEPDIIFGPFSLPLLGAAFGSQLKVFENHPPNIRKPFIKNLEDIHQLDFKKAEKSAQFNYFTGAVKGLVNQLGNKVPVAPITLNPVDLPIMLMGLENWLDLVLSDTKKAKLLIDKTTQFFVALCNNHFRSGAPFIVLPSMFTNPTIINKKIALDFQNKLKYAFSQVNGPIIIHEGGALLNPFLEIYQNLPNVAGFLVNRDDDLLQARSLINKNQVLAGNIEGPDIPRMSENQIVEKVKTICNKMGSDPHFIFASSGADLPLNTSLEKIILIKQTLNEIYGCQ